jgi:uncharacterized protein YkwD
MEEKLVEQTLGVGELILALTNEERDEAGVQPLTMHSQLREAAQKYAELMCTKEELGHAVDGQIVRMRLAAVGYKWSTYGENVAWNKTGRPDAQRVMNQWMGSPGHRRNILNGRFKEIGIGVAGPSERGRYYYCQIFGRPNSASFLLDVELVEESSSIYAEGGEDY